MRYEYKLVPAPVKGTRGKGLSAEARFATAVEHVLNDMAARGWEYQRNDTLPSTERAGLSGSETVWRNLLVFRRPHAEDASLFQPKLLEPPRVAPSAPETPVTPAPIPADAPSPSVNMAADSQANGAPLQDAPSAPPQQTTQANTSMCETSVPAAPEPALQTTQETAPTEDPSQAQDMDLPPPPDRPRRAPLGPADAADLALREALTGPLDLPEETLTHPADAPPDTPILTDTARDSSAQETAQTPVSPEETSSTVGAAEEASVSQNERATEQPNNDMPETTATGPLPPAPLPMLTSPASSPAPRSP